MVEVLLDQEMSGREFVYAFLYKAIASGEVLQAS